MWFWLLIKGHVWSLGQTAWPWLVKFVLGVAPGWNQAFEFLSRARQLLQNFRGLSVQRLKDLWGVSRDVLRKAREKLPSLGTRIRVNFAESLKRYGLFTKFLRDRVLKRMILSGSPLLQRIASGFLPNFAKQLSQRLLRHSLRSFRLFLDPRVFYRAVCLIIRIGAISALLRFLFSPILVLYLGFMAYKSSLIVAGRGRKLLYLLGYEENREKAVDQIEETLVRRGVGRQRRLDYFGAFLTAICQTVLWSAFLGFLFFCLLDFYGAVQNFSNFSSFFSHIFSLKTHLANYWSAVGQMATYLETNYLDHYIRQLASLIFEVTLREKSSGLIHLANKTGFYEAFVTELKGNFVSASALAGESAKSVSVSSFWPRLNIFADGGDLPPVTAGLIPFADYLRTLGESGFAAAEGALAAGLEQEPVIPEMPGRWAPFTIAGLVTGGYYLLSGTMFFGIFSAGLGNFLEFLDRREGFKGMLRALFGLKSESASQEAEDLRKAAEALAQRQHREEMAAKTNQLVNDIHQSANDFFTQGMEAAQRLSESTVNLARQLRMAKKETAEIGVFFNDAPKVETILVPAGEIEGVRDDVAQVLEVIRFKPGDSGTREVLKVLRSHNSQIPEQLLAYMGDRVKGNLASMGEQELQQFSEVIAADVLERVTQSFANLPSSFWRAVWDDYTARMVAYVERVGTEESVRLRLKAKTLGARLETLADQLQAHADSHPGYLDEVVTRNSSGELLEKPIRPGVLRRKMLENLRYYGYWLQADDYARVNKSVVARLRDYGSGVRETLPGWLCSGDMLGAVGAMVRDAEGMLLFQHWDEGSRSSVNGEDLRVAKVLLGQLSEFWQNVDRLLENESYKSIFRVAGEGYSSTGEKAAQVIQNRKDLNRVTEQMLQELINYFFRRTVESHLSVEMQTALWKPSLVADMIKKNPREVVLGLEQHQQRWSIDILSKWRPLAGEKLVPIRELELPPVDSELVYPPNKVQRETSLQWKARRALEREAEAHERRQRVVSTWAEFQKLNSPEGTDLERLSPLGLEYSFPSRREVKVFNPNNYQKLLEEQYHNWASVVPTDGSFSATMRCLGGTLPEWQSINSIDMLRARGIVIFGLDEQDFPVFQEGEVVLTFRDSEIRLFPHLKNYQNWTLKDLFRNSSFTQRLLRDSLDFIEGEGQDAVIARRVEREFNQPIPKKKFASMEDEVEALENYLRSRPTGMNKFPWWGGPYHYLLVFARKLLNLGIYENRHPGSVVNDQNIFPLQILEDGRKYSTAVSPELMPENFPASVLVGRPDFSPLSLNAWRTSPERTFLGFRGKIPSFVPKGFFDYILSSVGGYNPVRVAVPKQLLVRGLDQFFDQLKIVVKKTIPELVEEVQSIVRNDPNYGKYRKGSLIWRAGELVPEQLNPVAQVQKVLGVFDIGATMATFLFEEAREILFHQRQGAGELGLPDLSKFEQVKLFGWVNQEEDQRGIGISCLDAKGVEHVFILQEEESAKFLWTDRAREGLDITQVYDVGTQTFVPVESEFLETLRAGKPVEFSKHFDKVPEFNWSLAEGRVPSLVSYQFPIKVVVPGNDLPQEILDGKSYYRPWGTVMRVIPEDLPAGTQVKEFYTLEANLSQIYSNFVMGKDFKLMFDPATGEYFIYFLENRGSLSRFESPQGLSKIPFFSRNPAGLGKDSGLCLFDAQEGRLSLNLGAGNKEQTFVTFERTWGVDFNEKSILSSDKWFRDAIKKNITWRLNYLYPSILNTEDLGYERAREIATWVKADKAILGLVEEAEQGLRVYPAIPRLDVASGLPVVESDGRDTYYADIFKSWGQEEVRVTTTVHQTHGGTSTNIDNSVDNSVTYNINSPQQQSVEELADNLTKKLVEVQENRKKTIIATFKERGASVAIGSGLLLGLLGTGVKAANFAANFFGLPDIPVTPETIWGLGSLAGTGAFGVETLRWAWDRLGPERGPALNLAIQYGHVENRFTNSGNQEANQSMVENAAQIFTGAGAENAARGSTPGYLWSALGTFLGSFFAARNARPRQQERPRRSGFEPTDTQTAYEEDLYDEDSFE